MPADDVTIRRAVKDDCHQLLDLIQELAEYEKMPEAVHMTESRLSSDGFPDTGTPAFTVHVAQAGDKLIGMAFHYFTYSTWVGRSVYLEDLYVTPDWRGKGVGRRLFNTTAEWAVSNGCGRLNFSVLGWNMPAKDFYKRLGAVNLSKTEDWESYRVSGDALDLLAKQARDI